MNYKHGMRHTRFYRIWKNMIARANGHHTYCPNIDCDKNWRVFENFKKDMYKKYITHSKKYGEKNTSIDRIDNNLGYSKNNCRWGTPVLQSRNRKNNRLIGYNGETMTLAGWSVKMGIDAETISYRIKHGWSIEKALTTNVRKRFPDKVHTLVKKPVL